jgi:hypothetical protein
MNPRGLRFALVLAMVVAAFLAGAWLGKQPQTCAMVPSQAGTVLICSSELRPHMRQ